MSSRPDRSDAAPAAGRPLFPPASLGVIGSGQLGRMFIQAAQRMGYRAGVLSETRTRPAAQVAHWTVIGVDDRSAGTAGVLRAGRGGDRRVRERLGTAPAVAGPPSAGAARLANGLGLPEPAAREELPGPAWGSPCALAAGSERGRARCRRPGAGPAADPQDRLLGLRRQGADPGRCRRRPAPRLGRPGPGALRRRGVGRVRRRGLGGRRSRRRTVAPFAIRSPSTGTIATSWTAR